MYKILDLIRDHEQDMVKLKKLLTESCKARRLRRIYLNIQITFLTWFVELLGFFVIILGSFIIGYTNTYLTLCFQTISECIYTAIVPGMYLVNDSSSKDKINDSSFYISLHKILRMNNNSEGPNNEDQNGEDNDDQGEQNENIDAGGDEGRDNGKTN